MRIRSDRETLKLEVPLRGRSLYVPRQAQNRPYFADIFYRVSMSQSCRLGMCVARMACHW